MRKEISLRFLQKAVRTLVCAFVLLGGASSADAWAQDAISDRYAAIRAPTEALVDRIALQRLQADLNALTRERGRVQGRLRQTEFLRLQDPVSGLAAAERALDGRLDQIRTDLKEIRARLADHARRARDEPMFALPSLRVLDPDIARLGMGATEFDDGPMTESVDAARAFVEDLLRANRARP